MVTDSIWIEWVLCTSCLDLPILLQRISRLVNTARDHNVVKLKWKTITSSFIFLYLLKNLYSVFSVPAQVKDLNVARSRENPTSNIDVTWNQPEGRGTNFTVSKIDAIFNFDLNSKLL